MKNIRFSGLSAPLIALYLFVVAFGIATAADSTRYPLEWSHIPPALATAKFNDTVEATRQISMTLVLPLRDQDGLKRDIQRLYTPGDSLYGKYFTQAQFTAKYGPTEADVAAVTNFALVHGFTVKGVSKSLTDINVSATAANINYAFGVTLQDYVGSDGVSFYAPDRIRRSPAILPESS
jgi:subtilase family serine protease